MQLFHKYRLTPFNDEESKIHHVKAQLEKILESDMDPSQKMALYRDLLAKLRAFQQEANKPPLLRIENLPAQTTVIKKIIKEKRPQKRLPKIRQTLKKEFVKEEPIEEPEIFSVKSPPMEEFFSPEAKSPSSSPKQIVEPVEEFAEPVEQVLEPVEEILEPVEKNVEPEKWVVSKTPKTSRSKKSQQLVLPESIEKAPQTEKSPLAKRTRAGRVSRAPQRYGFGRKRKNLPMGDSFGQAHRQRSRRERSQRITHWVQG